MAPRGGEGQPKVVDRGTRPKPLPINIVAPGLAAATKPIPTPAQRKQKQRTQQTVNKAIEKGLTSQQRGQLTKTIGFRGTAALEQELSAARATRIAALNTQQAKPLTTSQRRAQAARPPMSRNAQLSLAADAALRALKPITSQAAKYPTVNAPVPYSLDLANMATGQELPTHLPSFHTFNVPVTNPSGSGILDAPNAAGIAGGQGGNPALAGLEVAGLFPIGIGKLSKIGEALKFGKVGATEAKIAEDVAAKSAFYANLPADAQKIADSLPNARGVIRAQEQLRRAERAKRFAAAKAAKDAAGGGEAGLHAYLHELRGPMPTLKFDDHGVITQESFDNLLNHIDQFPAKTDTDKLSAKLGLVRMVRDGIAPQPAQLEHLHDILGFDFTNQLIAGLPWWKHTAPLAAGIINIPRSIMASFDVSAPFRQGLILGARHPITFAKEFKPMFKALGSEEYYKSLISSIHSDPWYKQATQDGLSLTDPEGALVNREEQFMYKDVAEKIPGIGHGVRASGRAYTGFLDKFRFDVYKMYAEHAASIGRDFRDNPKIGESVARFINSATGRGSFTKNSKVEAALNATFFSPRLFKSRLDFLNPVYYWKLDRFARKQAAIAFGNLLGAVSATLYLAHLAGAKVNLDPTNADFAKIRFGNTRIDILGGLQQPVRLGFQLLERKVTSSTTGRTLNLGAGYGALKPIDIIMRFGRGKLNPSAGVVADLLYESDFQGRPLSLRNELTSHLTPLAAQDAADTASQYDNPALGAASYGLGAFGIGIQTYGPRPAGQTSISKFVKDSRAAGLGDPPSDVMDEIKIRKTYDSAVSGSADLKTKFKAAAKAYEQITGDSAFNGVTPTTGAEASAWIEAIRGRLAKLTTHYDAWEAVLQKREHVAALR